MTVREYYEFYSPRKTVFGIEISKDLGSEVEMLGGKRALLVSDRGVNDAGLLDGIRKSIEESSIELADVYTDVPVNSEVETCVELAEIAKSYGVDTLVSVGGGSVIDTAKGANILLSIGGDLLEDWQGTNLIPNPLNNHIAIPTTAGTGAESSLGAVVKNTPTQQKISFNSPYLIPDLAVLDPTLTLTMPKSLTAATGIDALTHAIESFTSLEHAPHSDALSFHTVALVYENLPRAFQDGSDIDARSNMLVAANIAGIAISTTLSIGACHAMAHATGGLSTVTHGVANAIILPVVMEYNFHYCTDRYALLARAIGIDTKPLIEAEAARAFVDGIKEFLVSFGLPKTLKEAGADPELAERMAEEALGDAQIYRNPREATYDEILELFKSLLE